MLPRTPHGLSWLGLLRAFQSVTLVLSSRFYDWTLVKGTSQCRVLCPTCGFGVFRDSFSMRQLWSDCHRSGVDCSGGTWQRHLLVLTGDVDHLINSLSSEEFLEEIYGGKIIGDDTDLLFLLKCLLILASTVRSFPAELFLWCPIGDFLFLSLVFTFIN